MPVFLVNHVDSDLEVPSKRYKTNGHFVFVVVENVTTPENSYMVRVQLPSDVWLKAFRVADELSIRWAKHDNETADANYKKFNTGSSDELNLVFPNVLNADNIFVEIVDTLAYD